MANTPKVKAKQVGLRLLGKGNNGAAYRRHDGVILKVTSDPSEVAMWTAIYAMQAEGVNTAAFPRVHDIRFGDRVAVVLRENITPVASNVFPQQMQTLMARDARWHLAGVTGSGRVRTTLLSQQQLRPLGVAAAYIRRKWDVSPGDIRPGNLGRRIGSHDLVLFDVGRSPLETTVAKARGYACPALELRSTQIRALVGKAPSVRSCKVVNGQQLRRVMINFNWSAQEAAETAGFHDPSRRIWLRQGNEDSLTHELWHAVGVLDKDMAVWLCEGLTEAAAQDTDKMHGVQHLATYPEWVKVVRNRVAPLAGLSVIDLAKLALKSPTTSGVRLAQLLQHRTGIAQGQWYQTLGPGSNDPRDFLALQGKAIYK